MEAKNDRSSLNNEGLPKSQVIIVGEQNPEKNKKSNGLAATSLALGVLSLIFFWFFFWPVLAAVTGLICGIISVVQQRAGEKMAKAGTITSAIGLLLSLIGSFLWIVAMIIIR